jgi:uncharacterized protein YbgA (DUF1722 family)/uncharacterized protein YbbK (DUF523 family)
MACMLNKEFGFPKPVILISRCLGFDRCRYNGIAIDAPFVASLTPFAEFIAVCPEVEIELGVPRDPIRVVRHKGKLHLVQPASGRDLTDAMGEFGARFVGGLRTIDGAILKSRSPSCGIKDTKIYPGEAKTNAIATGAGFFGDVVLRSFPSLPIEDEGRLLNLRIREHFLTRIFAGARWRRITAKRRMKDLVEFHSNNKLLLMAYQESGLRILGKIVANHEKKPIESVFSDYGKWFYQTMKKMPKIGTNANVLLHALGYFSIHLNAREKQFFLDVLGKYRRGKVPLGVCLGIMNSWITRFSERFLAQQSYFVPYPDELVEVHDSGKDRDVK